MSTIVHTIKLVTSYADAVAGIQKYGDSITACAQTVQKNATLLSGDKLLVSANALTAAVDKIGGATTLTNAQQAKLNATLTEAIAKYQALGQTAPAAMVALEKATETATQRVETLGKAGTVMTAAITVPLLAVGALALKAAVDFDAAGHIIQATTGATGDKLAGLQQSFSAVFAQVPESAQVVAKAIADLSVRTGESGTQLEALATQELNLARIGNTEVGPLIQQTTRLFASWKIATDEQSASLDYLYKVSARTGANVGTLSESLVTFGPVLRSLGIDFDHAAALLGSWEQSGLNAEKMLTGLRMAYASFAKQGIDPATGLQNLITKMQGAKTESEAASLALSVFGKRTLADMVPALESGKFNVDALVASLKASTVTINDTAFGTMSLSQQMEVLKHDFEEALVPIGKVLLDTLKEAKPLLQDAAEHLKSLAEGFQALPKPAQEAAIGLAGILLIVGPLAIGIAKLVTALETLGGSAAFGLLVKLAGSAGGITAIGALIGGAVTDLGLKAAMGGQNFSQVQGNIADVLSRSHGAVGTEQYLHFETSETVTPAAPAAAASGKRPWGGGDVMSPAQKKALDELSASSDHLTASQKALALSYLELGKSASTIAEAKGWDKADLEAYAKEMQGPIEASTTMIKLADDFASAQQIDLSAGSDFMAQYGKKADEAVMKAQRFGVAVKASVQDVADAYRSQQAQGLQTWMDDQVKNLDAKWMASEAAAAQKVAAALNASLVTALVMRQAYGDKLDELASTETDRQLTELDRQKRAALQQLGEETVANKTMWEGARANIDLYFDEEAKRIKDSHIEWQGYFDELEKSFNEIGQNLGGAAGNVVKDIGSMFGGLKGYLQQVSALSADTANQNYWQNQAVNAFNAGDIDSMVKALDKADKATTKLNVDIAAMALSGVASFAKISSSAGAFSNVVNGAIGGVDLGSAIGKAFGSVSKYIPIIGGIIGAIGGLIGGLFGGESAADKQADQNIQQVNTDLLTTYGTLQNIRLVSQLVGSDLYNLIAGAVWGQAGLSAEQTSVDALAAAEQKLIDSITTGSGVATQQLLDLMQLYSTMSGQYLTTAQDYYTAQTSNAAAGIVGVVEGFQTSINELNRQVVIADEMAAGMTEDAATSAAASITTTMRLSDTEIYGLGEAVAGTFAEMISRGTSFDDTLKALQPAIDDLQTTLTATGQNGGAAFALISGMAAIAGDAVTGPLFSAIENARTALNGLHNAGILTQDMFTGISASATDAYAQIVASGKDAQTALVMSAPELQTVYELQKNFNFTLDPATQALLDQAIAAGIVGDKQLSDTAQASLALQKTADELGVLVDWFQKLFPQAIEQAFEAALVAAQNDLLTNQPSNGGSNSLPGSGGGGSVGAPNVEQKASGTRGFEYYGAGRMVQLHNWEAVVPLAQAKAGSGAAMTAVLAARAASAAASAPDRGYLPGGYPVSGGATAGGAGWMAPQSSGATSQTVDLHVHSPAIYLDGRQIAESTVKHIPGVLKRAGV